MKTFELCKAFLEYIASLKDEHDVELFAGWTLLTGQTEEEFAVPAAIFDAHAEPLAGSAHYFRGILTVWVESHAQDDSAETHAGRVELLRSTLFGATAADGLTTRTAVMAAINAANSLQVIGYSAESCDPTIEQARFKTPLALAVGYRV